MKECLSNNEYLKLTGYSDADWGSNDIEMRSTTGFCYTLNTKGGAISWKSRRQPTVALSSCEAEYMALAAATQEALYLTQLLNDFKPHNNPMDPVVIFEDNQGAISLVDNPINHARTKHINIRFHFIREQVLKNFIKIKYLPTADMVADCLTKPVGKCNTIVQKCILR